MCNGINKRDEDLIIESNKKQIGIIGHGDVGKTIDCLDQYKNEMKGNYSIIAGGRSSGKTFATIEKMTKLLKESQGNSARTIKLLDDMELLQDELLIENEELKSQLNNYMYTSIDDDMPETEGYYLCKYNDCVPFVCEFKNKKVHNGTMRWFEDLGQSKAVTLWMPLPKKIVKDDENKLSAGICDKCKNLTISNLGGGMTDPDHFAGICKIDNSIIEPVPEKLRMVVCDNFVKDGE